MAKSWWDKTTGGIYHGTGNLVDNLTGENQANAARDASNAQVAQQNKALDLQKSIYDQNKANFQPYLDQGGKDYQNFSNQVNAGAFNNQAFNPTQQGNYQAPSAYQDKGFSLAGLAQDPGYQFRLQQGLGAVQNSAAARGMLHSGNTLAGLNDYAQGFASNEANNAFNRYTNQRDFGNQQNVDQRNFGADQFNNNRNFNYGQQQDVYSSGVNANANRFSQLSALAGYGPQAANSLAGLGQNYSNAASQTLGNIGDAQASGRIGASNAFGQGTQNIMNAGFGLAGAAVNRWGK
jgi:hypothetical protein